MAELGYPHERYPTAIVAGTNGKGSTCAMLASILQRAGYRTGLYTSPHLVRVNERIRVNGAEVSDQDFAIAFTEVAATVERLARENKLEKTPSFFEFLTAAAFLHFRKADVQLAVLEVGMGGRLDATNVTDPRVALITNVDYDHVDFLGSTLAAIAAEKAGVIKPHRAVISGVEDPEAAAVIRRRAQESEAELLEMAKLAQITGLHGVQGRYAFDLAIDQEHFAGLSSPLLGKFQVKNTAAAVAAVWRLAQDGFEIPRRCILQGLGAAAWPGRLEPILRRPLVLLDGAHNPAAARALATFIREELPGRRLRVVYASMRDKAMGEISEILFPLAEEVYLTRPEAGARRRPGGDSGRAYSSGPPRCAWNPSRSAPWKEPVPRALRMTSCSSSDRSFWWAPSRKRSARERCNCQVSPAAPPRSLPDDAMQTTSPSEAKKSRRGGRVRYVLSYARSLLFTNLLIYFYTAVCGTFSLLGSLFDAHGRWQHACARAWSWLILKTSGIRVRVEGLEHVQPRPDHDLLRESPKRHGYPHPLREPAGAVSLRRQALAVSLAVPGLAPAALGAHPRGSAIARARP